MQLEKLQRFVLDKLKIELPAHLTYHDVGHTIRVLQHAE